MKRIAPYLGPFLPLLLLGCGDLSPEADHVCEHTEEANYRVSQQAIVDCTERADTGYIRGESYPITVVTVDGKPVATNTANAYWLMQNAAAADGVQIRIVSGFRTQAEQQYLYNCYINGNCNNGNLAARPGYSNHQSGLALDLNTSAAGVLTWLNANGESFGFRRTVPSENWHWEWRGGVPDAGICGIEFQGCEEPITPEGGVIDNGGTCFKAYGPNQYWRHVNDDGVEGSLIWTNAFTADAPSCWARWFVNIEEAGRYQIEISRTDAYFVFDSTRYRVRANGVEENITIDQSAGSADWQVLGEYDFAAGEDQWVSVYDNTEGVVLEDQHVGADAIRITLAPTIPDAPDPVLGDPVEPHNPDGETPSGDEEYVDDMNPDVQVTTESGCSAAGTMPTLWGLLLLLGWRRRSV